LVGKSAVGSVTYKLPSPSAKILPAELKAARPERLLTKRLQGLVLIAAVPAVPGGVTATGIRGPETAVVPGGVTPIPPTALPGGVAPSRK